MSKIKKQAKKATEANPVILQAYNSGEPLHIGVYMTQKKLHIIKIHEKKEAKSSVICQVTKITDEQQIPIAFAKLHSGMEGCDNKWAYAKAVSSR